MVSFCAIIYPDAQANSHFWIHPGPYPIDLAVARFPQATVLNTIEKLPNVALSIRPNVRSGGQIL